MSETHGLTLTRLMGYTAVVVATLALLLVVYRLGEVVLLFVLSIVVAAALRKGVVALENRRVPRGLAILCWYLVVIGILGAGVYVLGAGLGRELGNISEELPQRYDVEISWYRENGTDWQQSLAGRLPDTQAVIEGLGADEAAEIGFQIAGLTSGILSFAISLVAVLTLTFYWLVDQDRFERLWLTLLPVQQRAVARHTWRGTEHRVGAYVRSEAAQFVITITVLWLAFQVLGLRYPTLYALYAGVVQLIPWVGIPLTLVPLTGMLFAAPLWQVIATGAIIVVVGVLMDRVIEPRLRGDAVVHPILTVLALMILGEASGIVGMLIALPLAATIQILLSELVHTNFSPKAMTVAMETTQIQELRARIEKLGAEVPQDEEHRREAEGLLARVTELMDRTEEVVREKVAATPRTRSEAARRAPAMLGRTRPS